MDVQDSSSHVYQDESGSGQHGRSTLEKCLKEAYRLHRSEIKSQQNDFEQLEKKYEKLQLLNERSLEKARSLQEQNKNLLLENTTLKELIDNTKSRGMDGSCILCSSLQGTLSSVDKAYKETLREKEKIIKILETRLREYTNRDAGYTTTSQKSHDISAKNKKPAKKTNKQSPDSTSKASAGVENYISEQSTSPGDLGTYSRLQLARRKQKRSRYTEDQIPTVNKKPRQEENLCDDVRPDDHDPNSSYFGGNSKIVEHLSDGSKKQHISEKENSFCVLVPETCDAGSYTAVDELDNTDCDTPPKKSKKNKRNGRRNVKINTSSKVIPDTCDISHMSDTENQDDTVAGTPDKCEPKKSLRLSQKIKPLVKVTEAKNKAVSLVLDTVMDSCASGVDENDLDTDTQITVKEATQRKRHVSLQDLLHSPESDSGDVYDDDILPVENIISHITLNLSGSSHIEDDDDHLENTDHRNQSGYKNSEKLKNKSIKSLNSTGMKEKMDETVLDEGYQESIEANSEITMLSPNFREKNNISDTSISLDSSRPVMTSTQKFDSSKCHSPQVSLLRNDKLNWTPQDDKSPSIFAEANAHSRLRVTTENNDGSEFSDPESPLLIREISDSWRNKNRNKTAAKNTDQCPQQVKSKAMSDISNNYNSDSDKIENNQKKLSPHNKKISPTNKKSKTGSKVIKKAYGKLEFDEDIQVSRVLRQTTLSQVFTGSPLKKDKGQLDPQAMSAKEKEDIKQAIRLSIESHKKQLDKLSGTKYEEQEKENSPFKKPSVPRKRRTSTPNAKKFSQSSLTPSHEDPDETIAPHVGDVDDKTRKIHSDIEEIPAKSLEELPLNGSLDPDIQLSLYCDESEDFSSESTVQNSCRATAKPRGKIDLKSKRLNSSISRKNNEQVEVGRRAGSEPTIKSIDFDLESESESLTVNGDSTMCEKNAESTVGTGNNDDPVDNIELEGESQKIPSSYKFGRRKRRSIQIVDNFSEGSDCDQIAPPQEKNLDDSFDRIPQKRESDFAYIDVVKKQDERRKLTGHVCQECYDYYKTTGMSESEIQKRIQNCSRHRARYVPPDTPEHFWSIGFPDTQECEERGYINVAENVGPSRHRRKRQLQKRFKSRMEEMADQENEEIDNSSV